MANINVTLQRKTASSYETLNPKILSDTIIGAGDIKDTLIEMATPGSNQVAYLKVGVGMVLGTQANVLSDFEIAPAVHTHPDGLGDIDSEIYDSTHTYDYKSYVQMNGLMYRSLSLTPLLDEPPTGIPSSNSYWEYICLNSNFFKKARKEFLKFF